MPYIFTHFVRFVICSLLPRNNQISHHNPLHAYCLNRGRVQTDTLMQAPTASGKLDGRWQLLYTTRPGTASPIQRSFIGVESFNVFQDISLGASGQARVINVVLFGKDGSIGQLKVGYQQFETLAVYDFKLYPEIALMDALGTSSWSLMHGLDTTCIAISKLCL